MRPLSILAMVTLGLFTLPLHAAVVDCSGATPGFTTITTALLSLPATGPQTISVSGTCHENVVVRRDDLTIEGNPTATIQPPSGRAVQLWRSEGVILRHLTISGGNFGVYAQYNSDLTLEDVTIENAGTGLVVDTLSTATAGGGATRAVLIHNNNYGVILDHADFEANGYVTIENNNAGMDAETSRVGFIGTVGPNYVRNSVFTGITAHGNSDLDLRGTNGITGNGVNGILVFESSSADIIGPTTIDGNGRSGIAYIFNSSGRVSSATVTNNGTAGDPLSSGVTASNNASVIVSGTTISNTAGPAIIVDSGGMGRLSSTTISGGSAEPVRLATGAVLEVQDGNSITGTATCDDSVVLFGSGASGFQSTCKKTK